MNNTFPGAGSLLTASSGTVLNHIQVDDYGLLELEAYAKLCGEMLFAENALFTVDSRSTLDFTISGRNTSAGYLVNDLSVISGIPDYTLTVSADQSAGTYKLAQNAAAFSESITIRSGSTTLGDVTIDTDLTLNNKVYDLNLVDGNLTLTIKVIVPPEELPGVPPGVHVPATDIKNRGFSQVLAWDKNRGAVGMINNNGNFPAAWIGNLDKSFAVESVGDYDADGKEDILLREQNSGWGGLGFWGAGYAGNWVDMNARIETDTRISGSKFDIIA
ncbi:MAG: hypothetical protein IKA32_04695 [Lentisphaeria bacterium]|nr:hypothetical protein [Lentisphaeria bacterium]